MDDTQQEQQLTTNSALAHQHLADQATIVYLAAICVSGTVGNLITVLVYSSKKDKSTSTFFITVLAISDLFVCLLAIPLSIYMELNIFTIDSIFFCRLYSFLTTSIIPFGCMTMTTIAVDRYLFIFKSSSRMLTLRWAKLIAGLLSFFSSLLSIIPTMSSFIATPMINSTNKTLNLCRIDLTGQHTEFGHLTVVFKDFYDLIYLISALIVLVAYVLIYKKVKKCEAFRKNRRRLVVAKFSESMAAVSTSSYVAYNLQIRESISPIYYRYQSEVKLPVSASLSFRHRLTTSIGLNSSPTVKLSKRREGVRQNSLFEMENLVSPLGKHLSNSCRSLSNQQAALTQQNVHSKSASKSISKKQLMPFLISIRDIRMLVILFTITVLCMFSYLPSILFSRDIVKANSLFVFYSYFSNSAMNPIVYSLMNKNFRLDVKKKLKALSSYVGKTNINERKEAD